MTKPNTALTLEPSTAAAKPLPSARKSEQPRPIIKGPHPFSVPRCLESGHRLHPTEGYYGCPCGRVFEDVEVGGIKARVVVSESGGCVLARKAVKT